MVKTLKNFEIKLWLLYFYKIQQTKMLVTCQRFGDFYLFGLVWQYFSVQTKYNEGRLKVTILLHVYILSELKNTAKPAQIKTIYLTFDT